MLCLAAGFFRFVGFFFPYKNSVHTFVRLHPGKSV